MEGNLKKVVKLQRTFRQRGGRAAVKAVAGHLGRKLDLATMPQIQAIHAALDGLRNELAAQRLEVSSRQAELDAQRAEIAAQRSELDIQRAELACHVARLDGLKGQWSGIAAWQPELLRLAAESRRSVDAIPVVPHADVSTADNLPAAAIELSVFERPDAPAPEVGSPAAADSPVSTLDGWKHHYAHFARLALDAFLAGGARLSFSEFEAPAVSIILVLHDRAELTLSCLSSLRASPFQGLEIILVDNGSTDATGRLLDRLEGVKVLRNQNNRGYTVAVNQGAAVGRGSYLLLLNNDTQLLGDCLGVARRFLDAHPDVGGVGGKVILPDGTLQEAGAVIGHDGYTSGYGRGRSPDDPACAIVRDVDYCSAVFLMTPRDTFFALGGLDERFNPGYYEDADYCLRLWQVGRRVVYHPQVALLHYESASSKDPQQPRALCAHNRIYFLERHGRWLSSHRSIEGSLSINRATQNPLSDWTKAA